MRRAKLDATEKEQTMASSRILNKGTDMLQLDIASDTIVDLSEATVIRQQPTHARRMGSASEAFGRSQRTKKWDLRRAALAWSVRRRRLP